MGFIRRPQAQCRVCGAWGDEQVLPTNMGGGPLRSVDCPNRDTDWHQLICRLLESMREKEALMHHKSREANDERFPSTYRNEQRAEANSCSLAIGQMNEEIKRIREEHPQENQEHPPATPAQ